MTATQLPLHKIHKEFIKQHEFSPNFLKRHDSIDWLVTYDGGYEFSAKWTTFYACETRTTL